MKKIEVMELAKKYGMEILRNPVTHEAHGVHCESETLIPELDALANKIDWHSPAPGAVAVERRLYATDYHYIITDYHYIIHCPTSWFDLWGWKE